MVDEQVRHWERLCELIWGVAIGQAIHVFVELGLPELLDAGPKSSDQLAAATGTDSWTLETILRALVAFDVLTINAAQQYSLEQMGRLLLRSAPGPSAGEAGEFFETIYRPLGALTHMVRTGDVAFDQVYGQRFYDYLSEQPRIARHFYDTMADNAGQRYAGLSSVCDLSNSACIIDVGGGDGSLLIQILREYPETRGITFDLPVVYGRATQKIRAAGLFERCEVVSGDFLQSVPVGGDVYILAQILNNWRAEEAQRILANCRRAMNSTARLLVLEPIYGVSPLSRWQALVSLGVMTQRGGRTRSENQLNALLSAESFEVTRILRLPASTTCAIEAKPAG